MLRRTAAAAVLVVSFLAACGGAQKIRTGDGKRVQVTIEGNDSFDDETLIEGLSLTRLSAAGQGFDPYIVALDEDRVRGFYLVHGHFAAEVSSRFEERDGVIEVVFIVDEGPRAKLTRIDVAGLPEDPEFPPAELRDELEELIPIEIGDPFVYEPYEEVKPRLVAVLQRAGYCHARLEATVAADRVRHEAIIRLEFEPGQVCFFGEVTLEGVEGPVREAAVARVEVTEGRRYSTVELEETRNNLYEMGRFSIVRIEPDLTTEEPEIPVRIRVTTTNRHELRLGGGLGLDPGQSDIHGRAGYTLVGWPRPLTTTTAELRPALVLQHEDYDIDPRVEAVLGFERLDLLIPYLRGEAEASLAYLAVEAYTTFGPRFRLGLRYPIMHPELQVSAGWQIRYLEFLDLDPALDEADAAEYGVDEPYRLGFYEQSVILDLRDNPIDTRQGLFAEVRAEQGTIAAGGAFEYVRVTPELRGYVPVPLRGIVAAARVRTGGLFGDLPVTQRYLSGGASSHRGFPERRLAPTITRVVDGETESAPIGGAGMFEVSGELRVPIGTVQDFDLGAVAFLDGGDVTERYGDLDVTHLHWAAGLGLRVATVIGPVRLDVAYRLNRYGADEPLPGDRFAFHLSLGEAF